MVAPVVVVAVVPRFVTNGNVALVNNPNAFVERIVVPPVFDTVNELVLLNATLPEIDGVISVEDVNVPPVIEGDVIVGVAIFGCGI